jgi:Do/DeqQ family serine protease
LGLGYGESCAAGNLRALTAVHARSLFPYRMISRSLAWFGLWPLLALAVLAPVVRAESAERTAALTIDDTPLRASEAGRVASYADVVAPVQRAVVSVYAAKTVTSRLQVPPMFRRFMDVPEEQSQRQEGLGSGVILTSDGYIVTNHHVVDGADELRVALGDSREFEAKLIGTDPKTDVAVIKIDAQDLPVATLADSDKLRVADIVFAIGNPLGVGQTVTMGIVSALGRNDLGILATPEVGGYENFIQTDAAINQGNSGGALVDAQGRLVGINTAILSAGGRGNIGIGFAIPINQAAAILRSLVATGSVQRGYLGVQAQTLTPEIAEALSLGKDAKGVVIADLPADSPAAAAGLKRSDVITAIDGRAIITMQDLRLVVAAKLPGSEVDLAYLRDGQARTTRVKLAELGEGVVLDQILPGIRAEPLSDELRKRIGVPADLTGVAITGVTEGSPYAERLTPGMVIVEIAGQAVASVADVKRLIQPGRNLVYIYHRGVVRPFALVVD